MCSVQVLLIVFILVHVPMLDSPIAIPKIACKVHWPYSRAEVAVGHEK